MKFLHTMIRVKDIDESLKFYKDIMGMELVKTKRLDDCTLYFLEDKEQNVQLELTYNDETPSNGYENGTAFGHFAFEVDDMNEFGKNLKDFGINYLYEPYEIFSGTLISFIVDPDGNQIELIQKAK